VRNPLLFGLLLPSLAFAQNQAVYPTPVVPIGQEVLNPRLTFGVPGIPGGVTYVPPPATSPQIIILPSNPSPFVTSGSSVTYPGTLGQHSAPAQRDAEFNEWKAAKEKAEYEEFLRWKNNKENAKKK
jgi:hypothetical protein